MKAASVLSSWENAQDVSRANLIFENRNKRYGGYFIRVYYPDRIFRAFLFAVFGFVALVNTPMLLEKFLGSPQIISIPKSDGPIFFPFPPPIDKPVIPPAISPPDIQKQLVKTTAWARPVVKDNPGEAEAIKTQEQLSVVNIDGKSTQNDSAAQIVPENTLGIDAEKTFSLYEIQELPEFTGGEKSLMEYLGKNIRYPVEALRTDIQGVVYVSFVVDKEGKISEAKTALGIGGGCDAEALRVVKAMPVWKPGRQNGRPVSVQYNLPVRFVLGR